MTEATEAAPTPTTESTPATPTTAARRNRRGGRGGRRNDAKTPATATDTPAGPPAAQERAARAPQSARKTSPLLERLFELYPKLFGARFLPLKLGVFEELVERHPEVLPREELKLAMGQHARSTRYLESVAAGLQRHDLDGNPVEPVAPEHVHHAIMEVFRRRQARTQDDLRPQLQTRIIAAAEASGLSHDAYAARVRSRDEAANAALDEAMAELGRQAAKREALMRAFEASGKTEAEFADMYGMDPKEVARTLQRVRKDKKAAQAAEAAAAATAAASTDAAEPLAESGDTPDTPDETQT